MTISDATVETGVSTEAGEKVRDRQSSAVERKDKGHAGPARWLGVLERYALVLVLIAVLLFFSFWSETSSTFATAANIRNVLGNQSVSGILALAIVIPLVCGVFDFSVGSVAGLSQVLCAGLMARLGAPVLVAILVAIAVGALIGLSNGGAVAKVGVNSIIVTLGVSSIALGFVEWYTNGQQIIAHLSTHLTQLGTGTWFGVPQTLYLLVVVALGVYYLLEHTPFGRYVHSIGSNAEAARLVGLPVQRYVLLCLVLSGTLAGVAGVLLVARNGGASPQIGTVSDTLQALSAAFLGATAIKPGRFNVLGTLVAILLLSFTVTGLSLAGVANWINDLFNGAALFVAVLISTLIGLKRAGS
jgi:ribose transport system permease protein